MILHFDFSTGASGDKILGALIEISEKLGYKGFEEVQRLGAYLVPNAQITRTNPTTPAPTEHPHPTHIQATGITVAESSPSPRNWQQIQTLIQQAGASGALPPHATRLALQAFQAIATAEATVHGVHPQQVHFHELGAADSIIDICASSLLLHQLAPDAVWATPLALGFGTVNTAHGQLPVPAPATALLIKGLPVYAGTHPGELTTPTGAALASAFVTNWAQLPCVKPHAVGYGAGTRTIPGAANVLRAMAAQPTSLAGLLLGAGFTVEGCTLLETNIDHLSPEALAFACEELLAQGALDVWQEPITMKKGRLAVRLSVLSSYDKSQQLAQEVTKITGSLGVRSTYVERTRVPRSVVLEDTSVGQVHYKTACVATPQGDIKLKRPEYEDVARIAREQHLDFNHLYQQLNEQM